MKHAFISAAPTDPDPTLVDGPRWNDTHVADVRAISSNDVQLSTDDFIEGTGGSGGISYTLLPPSGRKGRRVEVFKVDAGAGAVSIAATVNGDASGYRLVNRYQYVVLQVLADESGYLVVRNN